MSDKVKLNVSSLSLTQAEFSYLQSLVQGGDRNGFYLAYYAMAATNNRDPSNGAIELALQTKISSFSDNVGGTAYYANRVLQELFHDSYKGIYKLSQEVALSALDAIKDDLEGDHFIGDGVSDGIVSKDVACPHSVIQASS